MVQRKLGGRGRARRLVIVVLVLLCGCTRGGGDPFGLPGVPWREAGRGAIPGLRYTAYMKGAWASGPFCFALVGHDARGDFEVAAANPTVDGHRATCSERGDPRLNPEQLWVDEVGAGFALRTSILVAVVSPQVYGLSFTFGDGTQTSVGVRGEPLVVVAEPPAPKGARHSLVRYVVTFRNGTHRTCSGHLNC